MERPLRKPGKRVGQTFRHFDKTPLLLPLRWGNLKLLAGHLQDGDASGQDLHWRRGYDAIRLSVDQACGALTGKNFASLGSAAMAYLWQSPLQNGRSTSN